MEREGLDRMYEGEQDRKEREHRYQRDRKMEALKELIGRFTDELKVLSANGMYSYGIRVAEGSDQPLLVIYAERRTAAFDEKALELAVETKKVAAKLRLEDFDLQVTIKPNEAKRLAAEREKEQQKADGTR